LKKRFSSEARTLQWLDRRVGAPVCLLLTLVRRVGAVFGGGPPAVPVGSILFIKLAEQGSTVLAHDAVRRAVERVGRANVHFLVFEENRVLGRVRRRRFDACIDMEFFARFSAAIAYLTGARKRVGFHVFFGEGPYRGDLMTHRVLYNAHLHTSRTFTSLVLALDCEPAAFPTFGVVPPEAPPPPAFVPGDGEKAAVGRMLAQAGVPPSARIVVLNANAGDLLPLRKWDPRNYGALASRLVAAFPEMWVAFSGSPEEAPAVEGIARAVGSARVACLAGRTTLRELVILFGLAEVLVTNDSGPAHFAALTGVDVVSLFGPETPLLFAAPGPRSHPLWAGIACSPCVNAFNNRQTACRDNVCMKGITVDQVFEAVSRIYRERTAAAVR
jgi:ADP-heptose:LPS heptosyltransferase